MVKSYCTPLVCEEKVIHLSFIMRELFFIYYRNYISQQHVDLAIFLHLQISIRPQAGLRDTLLDKRVERRQKLFRGGVRFHVHFTSCWREMGWNYFFLPSVGKRPDLRASLFSADEDVGIVCDLLGVEAEPGVTAALILPIHVFMSSCRIIWSINI